MSESLLELEGTWSEIVARAGDFEGRRVRVIVLPAGAGPEMTPEPPRKPSLSETLAAMADAMPHEERAKMPPDLAEQHDHYIYGWPKR